MNEENRPLPTEEEIPAELLAQVDSAIQQANQVLAQTKSPEVAADSLPEECVPAQPVESSEAQPAEKEPVPESPVEEPLLPDDHAPAAPLPPLPEEASQPEEPSPEEAPQPEEAAPLPIYLRGQWKPADAPEQPYPNSGQQPACSPVQVPSTGQYFLMELLCSLPLVGLVVSLIWGLDDSSPAHRRNFARANLILILIRFVCKLVVIAILVGLFSVFSQFILGWLADNYYDSGYGYYDDYDDYDDYEHYDYYDDDFFETFPYFFDDYAGPGHGA